MATYTSKTIQPIEAVVMPTEAVAMHAQCITRVMYMFLLQNIDGTVTGSWEGIRVNAIATHPDSDLVYAADTHSRIRQYSFRDKSSSTL